MKLMFASLALGAVAASALLGFAPLADARQPPNGRGGGYVYPHTLGVGSNTVQEYCRDDLSYRVQHSALCSRFVGGDTGYSVSSYYKSNADRHNRDDRYRHRPHDRDDFRDQRERDGY